MTNNRLVSDGVTDVNMSPHMSEIICAHISSCGDCSLSTTAVPVDVGGAVDPSEEGGDAVGGEVTGGGASGGDVDAVEDGVAGSL